ncbi:MAG: peptidase M15 [Bradyrhizobium sp.]
MSLRLATMAALCREAAMPALVLTWIATSGFAAVDRTGAAPIADRLAPQLAAEAKFAADTRFADKPQPMALAAVGPSVTPDLSATPDLSIVSKPATAEVTTETISTETTPAPVPREPDPIVTAALTDPSETLRLEAPQPEAPSAPTTEPGVASREPGDINRGTDANQGIGSVEVLDECFVVEACVDRYLFALYQRAPKEDTVKIEERRKVTVKRKGKLLTVTRTFTTRADQDFAWKDPKAAERAGMSMADYVIGGMDRDFKLKLFHMLYAAEQQGLSPGITSAFRDDYRQSIASGLKAASDRSYHGGSLRGGYGHGMAADIVSINGATRAQRLTSTQAFWKWVDANGTGFGIGRPYLDHDPPHVGPVDGKEYIAKRPNANVRQEAATKRANRVATRMARAH